jgi:hypothetical protein
MSRNGSGTYTLPAGNPVVPATVISTTWANTTLSDIATALTGSVAADGQTPMSGNLVMGNNKVTGLANATNPTDAVTYSQFINPTFATLTVSGASVFNGTATFLSTDDIKIPVGSTAQRPTSPTVGMIRFNSDTNQYEGNKIVTGQGITSITFVSSTATLTTNSPHGLSTNDYVTIAGASPSQYNGTYSITVTGSSTFTYVMASTPATNATSVGTYYANLWLSIGGGATGSGGNQVFVENDKSVTSSYTITTGKNASSAGPITVNTGVTVTVPTGSRWVIV